MKQLIKSAIVYKADFGAVTAIEALQAAFEKHTFTECHSLQIRSIGFVNVESNDDGNAMAVPFQDGFAFRVRIDEKQIPASVVNDYVKKMVEAVSQREDRKVGKKERAELKEQALVTLAAQAFPRTTVITSFYQFSTGYLIIPTTSKKLADYITSLLVQAIGSVKTETIHVSNVKHGLTTRLANWANGDDDAFGVFHPCALAALQQDKRKISVQMCDLGAANSTLKEALSSSFEVTSLGLTHDGETEFRLTEDFRLKRIEFAHTDAEDDEEPSFYAQATLEVKEVSAVITNLIRMIGHGSEEGLQKSEAV